ncbi:MAG TPA: hypothetical protein VG938_04380 [Verrucomicrobiae bacterium]|nr:hypothetical protein [Verrucomicrobiae bacterium]
MCSAVLVGGSARAALLDISPQQGAPDLTASFITVDYTASDKTLVASGYSDTYYPTWGDGSAGTQLGAGTWKLTATLGANNGIVGGHLDVYNTYNVDFPSGSPDLLLSANLVAGPAGQVFGFSGTGAANHDEFDFLFQVQGGSLAGDYLAWGNIGGIILNADFASGGTPFTGDWSQDFNNAGVGDSQTFVPESSAYGLSAALVAVFGVGLTQIKRMRFCAFS